MQSLDVSDAVEFMRHRWFAVVHLTNSLEAILLQIGPVGEVADDPSERVAEVNASSDYDERSLCCRQYDKTNDKEGRHTACVRSQENLFIVQETLTKNVAKDGGSLVARCNAIFQVAKHLVNIGLLHAAILAGLFRFLVDSPLLNTEKLADHVASPASGAQDRDVVSSG